MTKNEEIQPNAEIAPFHGGDAAAVRKSATAARAHLTRSMAELEQRQAEVKADLERQQRELEAEFARKRAELEAQVAPLKAELAKLQEVMWTVDLYLGRDESLRLVRDGQPAPADTPITIRQKVLVMAEESLVLMDRKATGMTAEDIPEFVDWLLADDAHLNRILPEQKGVVVLIPTRVESQTGNAWEDASKDAANQSSWWLLRNGERLYLLTVDPELKITQRVLPRRDEFTEVFGTRLFGFGTPASEPVKPGSDEWLTLEKIADARRRHYMRIMLVLQGIIDRTPAWHPLTPAGVNLLSLADQDAGKIVLIQDDEDSIQLTDGRESFRDWQRRLNALLRPGLRVIGNWSAQGFQDLWHRGRGGPWDRDTHPRLHPETLGALPEPNVPHLIEGRKDGGLVIRYQRTDKIWKRNVPVPGKPGYVYQEWEVTPKQRASCVIKPRDSWVLPFDLVTVPELEYYLNSRDDRSKNFLSMVPTIKAALAAKRTEAEQEAPFRDLIGRLLINEGASPSAIDRLVDDLVHWWKIANTWSRPLNGDPDHEKKAAEAIRAEYRQRTQVADEADRFVAAARTIPGVICVARNRQGRWHAYKPSQPAPPGEHVYLDSTLIRKDGTLGPTKTWTAPPQRSASLLQVAWSTDEWSTWNFAANPRHYLTDPERQQAINELRDVSEGLPICITEFHDPQHPDGRKIAIYSWASCTPEDAPTRVTNDPLGWREEAALNTDQTNLIEAQARRVRKDAHGVHLERVQPRTGTFHQYSVQVGRLSGTPWWPDDAHQYGDARPRLIWSDPAMLDRVADYVDRCTEAWETERQEKEAFEERVYSYVNPTLRVIRNRIEDAANQRFIEDFGSDALDLWPAHLKTLSITDPIHPRDIWGLIAIALKHDHPVVGETLDDLADYAMANGNQAPGEWHPGHGRVDLGDHGGTVIPEPDQRTMT